MRYKTKEIGEAGIDVNLDLTATWLAESCPELEAQLAEDGLRLEGRIEPTGDDFLLRGSLKGALLMQCGHCLEPTTVGVDVGIAVQFIESDDDDADDDEDDDEDDGGFVRFQNGVIDLTGELREEIFLAVPMNPRCEPECPGVCLVCGRNRAKDPCDCDQTRRRVDERVEKTSPFAVLAKLKS